MARRADERLRGDVPERNWFHKVHQGSSYLERGFRGSLPWLHLHYFLFSGQVETYEVGNAGDKRFTHLGGIVSGRRRVDKTATAMYQRPSVPPDFTELLFDADTFKNLFDAVPAFLIFPIGVRQNPFRKPLS